MDLQGEDNAVKTATRYAENEMSEELFLEAYKKETYPKPSLTADIAVFRRAETGLSVLMVRRGNHPFEGFWALPGGFVNPNEDVEDAALRELEEETGIADISVELFGIYGTPGRDPRGWTVSGGFCALIEASREVKAGDDAADAQWCAIHEKVRESHPTDDAADSDSALSDTLIELEVTCGENDVLSVCFEQVEHSLGTLQAHIVTSEGFAFDHEQLFADAYLKVRRSSR